MSLLLMVAYDVDPGFLAACDNTLNLVLVNCRFITPTFMSIALLYTVGRGLLMGNGLQMDFSPLLKALWVLFLLYFYRDLLDVLGSGISGFTGLFATQAGATSAAEALQRLTTPAPIAAAAANDSLGIGDVVTGASNLVASISETLSSFTFSGLMTRFFTGTTVMLIREIMLFIRQFVLGFLYVCGPIAMSLSVVPSFGQLAIKWLQNFIAVQFWSLSFVLLDTMYTYYSATPTAQSGIGSGGVFNPISGQVNSVADTKFMMMSVAFVLLYCMVPYLTSLFIGSSAVQGFAGSMMGMAIGAATTAAGVASPGAGGVAGAVGRALGNGKGGGGGSSGGDSGGSAGSSAGGSAGGGGSSGSSVSSGLPAITMSDALNPQYRQRASGIWTS